MDELSKALSSYNDDILRELRTAEGDKRAHGEAYFDLAVALTTLLFSADDGELLRRRGRAAMAAAAA